VISNNIKTCIFNIIKLENSEGAIKKDNPDKTAIQDTQDEEKQNKNTTQHSSLTTTRKETHTTQKRHAHFYNWRQRRSEHRFHADIVTDITTKVAIRKFRGLREEYVKIC